MRAPHAGRSHVLLDLDGTISDSSPGITRSLQYAFTECGYPRPTDNEVRAVIGPPFEIGLPRLGIPTHDIERVVTAYRHRYEDIGLFENDVYIGISDLLIQLGESAILAVATAKPELTAQRIIEHFGLTAHFEVIAGATVEVGSHRRTKAAVITHALSVLGVRPGPHVVMIGDRDHDVHGATENGIDCIGVTWGFGSARELLDAGAVTVVDSPGDVVAALTTTYRESQS